MSNNILELKGDHVREKWCFEVKKDLSMGLHSRWKSKFMLNVMYNRGGG